MSQKKKNHVPNTNIVGIEFLRLTHWDRYILNENIAKLERELFPDDNPDNSPEPDNMYSGGENLWRGNTRRHYRLDTRTADLMAEIDFRPMTLKHYKAKILNISPAGCCLELPPGEALDISTRIPKIVLSFGSDTVVCRARVIYQKGCDRLA